MLLKFKFNRTYTFSLQHSCNVVREVICLHADGFSKLTQKRRYLSSDNGLRFSGKPLQQAGDGWQMIIEVQRQTLFNIHQQLTATDIHLNAHYEPRTMTMKMITTTQLQQQLQHHERWQQQQQSIVN